MKALTCCRIHLLYCVVRVHRCCCCVRFAAATLLLLYLALSVLFYDQSGDERKRKKGCGKLFCCLFWRLSFAVMGSKHTHVMQYLNNMLLL